MNELEGLHLTQLMDRMVGLVIPEPVSYAPQTPGWAIVAVFAVAVVAIFVLHAARVYRSNAYRRSALRELAAAEARWRAGELGVAGDIAEIVRRSALSAYRRRDVAGLFGASWAEFLAAGVGPAHGDADVTAGFALLAGAAYRPHVGDDQLRLMLDAARHWVGSHRA